MTSGDPATHDVIPATSAAAPAPTAAGRLLEGYPPRLRLTVRREGARERAADERRAFPSPCGCRTLPTPGHAAGRGDANPAATLDDAPVRGRFDASSRRSTEVGGQLPAAMDACPVPPSPVRGIAEPGNWSLLGDVATPRSLVRRADLIDVVRRDGPCADAPEVVRMRAVIDRPMVIADAIVASGDGDLGFQAVVRLIADGCVRMRDGWSITREKTVEPCGPGCGSDVL